jgi:hypothetical protein
MKHIASVAAALAVSSLMAGAAHAELSPAEGDMLDRIRNDPSLRAEALARLSKVSAPVAGTSRSAVAASTPKKAGEAAPAGKMATPYSPQHSKCPGFQFLLRKDWKDFDLLACPGPVKNAAGAMISFTGDVASGNRIWAVDATTAIVYSSLADPYEWWQPTYLNFGAYASVDRTFNSATAFTASDIDKLAYGGFVQFGYTSSTLQSFFRMRGNVAENNIKNVTAANFTAEYIPVYDPLYIHYPTPGFYGYALRFDPMLFVQYAEVTGKGQLLAFNNRREALRIGAEATLRLLPDIGAAETSRLSAAVTYRWANETYSGSNLSWFQSEITYNLDDAGHFALGFSYKRGNDEDTGAFTNVYKLGLTGKI